MEERYAPAAGEPPPPTSQMRIHTEIPDGAAEAPGVVVIMHGPAQDAWQKMLAFLDRHLKR